MCVADGFGESRLVLVSVVADDERQLSPLGCRGNVAETRLRDIASAQSASPLQDVPRLRSEGPSSPWLPRMETNPQIMLAEIRKRGQTVARRAACG